MPTPSHPEETLFISDLHLSTGQPETVALFLHFLEERAARAGRLIILGDLFDAWIGDDDDSEPNCRIRAALRTLTTGGTQCLLMHGNRDFLIGRRFARATGCRILPDPTLMHFDGEQTLLMHGDLLCTDDVPYLKFRKRVRNPLVKRIFLWKSLQSRRRMAEDYRRRSQEAIAEKTQQIMDVNAGTVAQYLARYGATRLIHGHTHRPGDHTHEHAGGIAHRQVLADWHPEGGEVLVHRPGHWQREPVRLPGNQAQ